MITIAAADGRRHRNGRQPGPEPRHLCRLRRGHPRLRHPGQQDQQERRGHVHRRGAFSGRQNGIAISGDYLSAASFLGIAGAIAINGYDGFLYSIGFLVAWLVALLLVAELLRNTGRFTMADVLSFRMREGPVRTAAATSTLAVSFFYLLAQMAGAGGLVALLMGISGRGGQSLVIAVVGPADDLLRAHRRDEGHDLRPDHQGGAAHRRGRDHERLGPCPVGLQLLRRPR